ncbi:MAG: response regulator [Candidatus Magnetomorum sp.]|nr:response regulator [Candidatus Magnetomorum sp.]
MPEKEVINALDDDNQKKSKTECLIVEDNLINQTIISRLLKKLGIDSDIAKDGIEAIEAVKKKLYDIIFMDIQMPRMDGIQATKCILNDCELEKKPVIVAVTANVSEKNAENCRDSGMKEFITKPVSLKILQDAIHRWVG